MLTTEPRFNQIVGYSGECVLCGRPLSNVERDRTGGEFREFCTGCVEQEFADDALELWSWFCGPAETASA